MASSIFSRLQFIIGADNRQFLSSIQQSQKQLVTLQKGFSRFSSVVGGIWAGNFLTQPIINFLSESKKLGDSLAGILPAFQRLGQPGLLDNLVRSTQGTVSNLELMRQAVRASNFQIPIENLGKLFQFAQIRAKETGESVDFLVNSIISGIGRKSPLILDNLGISAVRLRKALKGVGVETADVGAIAAAVGGIIDEELGQRGSTSIDEVAVSSEKFAASLSNIQTIIGSKLAPITAEWLSGWTEDLDKIGLILTADLNAAQKILAVLTRGDFTAQEIETRLQQIGALEKSIAIISGTSRPGIGVSGLADQIQGSPGAIEALRDRIKSLGEQIEKASSIEQLPGLNQKLERLKEELKGLRSLGVEGSIDNAVRINPQNLELLKDMNDQLKELKFTFDSLTGAAQTGIFSKTLTEEFNAATQRLGDTLLKRDKKGEVIGGVFAGIGTSKDVAGQKALDNATKNLNNTLLSTQDIAGVLQSSFTQLFDSILQGGLEAEDIFKRLASSLLSIFVGGIFGKILGGGFALGNAADYLGSSNVPLARVTGDQLTFIQSRNNAKLGRVGG